MVNREYSSNLGDFQMIAGSDLAVRFGSGESTIGIREDTDVHHRWRCTHQLHFLIVVATGGARLRLAAQNVPLSARHILADFSAC